ncbi:PspC domain-containing protein [Colwellia sp. M166]|uniref:PspC domain-containing protein n=1 Tax=Colwellia sp. M166 TaxID=2583805 RepID=UPI00211DE2C6|nr:PspC domain-containing protein [Colwellia sp. M166]UUO24213.1 PspC domain-containing protein [Colwellia sp. M166]|tara:strand:+ start:6957 stop:7169 length:213 start_codon:yes stop_codon:yes gene_type:complete
MSFDREYSVNKTLTKDMVHKKLSGVCGGIAKHYNLPRIAVRVGAIVALLMFPVATGVAYLVATLLMPTKA